MSWEIRDRYLWLGFGAFLFVAVRQISSSLHTTIKLSEVYDPDHAKAANDTQAEDAVSLEALSTLVTSPNQDISNSILYVGQHYEFNETHEPHDTVMMHLSNLASKPTEVSNQLSSAISLILSRFAQDEQATSSLTIDLFSSSPATRLKAKQSLDLFDNHYTLDLYPLNDTTVSSLHDKSNPTTQLMCRAYFRAARKYRQGRLGSLVEIAVAVEESTRISQRSQRGQRYPETHFVFPQGREGEVVGRFQPAGQRVESLVGLLAEQAVATRPMVRFAAVASGETSGVASSTTSELPVLEEVEVVVVDDQPRVARARFQSSTNQEAEARRRRREVMVLHEGGGMIGTDDIIHPRTNNRS
ncbi:hypothetical protein E4T38_04965 [Aureobasidium subglaciale]|nr:hypothetical protein E4T38_04965 [Aureobasidium subglaciale]KAI5222230.1 hypothetical protein E4T40_05003 [Aureobasidium subglaciale]KAI5226342.1 hypothetical protein E4T41_04822 [Aureobasidium subglaciale]KAI5262068.1 hypothetical protein E4T46_04715 [Aureobasidium subglaciale]